jgi:hypothetical protein
MKKSVYLIMLSCILSLANSCSIFPFSWDCQDSGGCGPNAHCVKEGSYPFFSCRCAPSSKEKAINDLTEKTNSFLSHEIKTEENLLLGNWENELGSSFVIDWQNNGEFKGNYLSAVGRSSSTTISGSYIKVKDGYLITFHAKWENDELGSSMTTWIGKLTNGTIYTTWILFRDDDSLNNWSSYITNKDTFKRE